MIKPNTAPENPGKKFPPKSNLSGNLLLRMPLSALPKLPRILPEIIPTDILTTVFCPTPKLAPNNAPTIILPQYPPNCDPNNKLIVIPMTAPPNLLAASTGFK